MALHVHPQPRRSSRRTILLVGGVLIMLLLLSLAAGVLAGNGRNTLTLLLAFGPLLLFGSIFASRRFDLVVLALPLAALAIPLEVPTGTETKLPAALLLALALFSLWIPTMIVRGHYRLAPSPLNKPILAFNVICCISLVWGIAWRDPILIDAPKFIVTQIASLITFLVSTGAALLIGNFVKTRAQLKYIVIVFIVCGALMTITELFHISQPILNDRGLWGMWTVTPAYGLLLAQPKLRWRWRILLLAVIVATLYQTAVVNADWISGWVPTIVAMLAATFLRSKKAFVVLVIIVAISAYSARDFFAAVADDNINDGSLERLTLWEQNWRVVSAHWLLGTGPAGYALYYMTYYRDDARSTHNNYLDILAQFGFVGMGIWLWLALIGVYEGWRLSVRAPPGFLRTLAIIATAGWIGAQASMFFGDWVLPFAYNQGVGGYKYTVYSWLFLGTLISIRQLLPQISIHTKQRAESA
ncbi:MAG: O-antigen ligase family protein [Roseiflexaceae bacterium]